MSDMETLIVIFALIASFGGTVILLSCLAGRRAELVKAFNVQQQAQAENDSVQVEMGDDGVATVSGINP